MDVCLKKIEYKLKRSRRDGPIKNTAVRKAMLSQSSLTDLCAIVAYTIVEVVVAAVVHLANFRLKLKNGF